MLGWGDFNVCILHLHLHFKFKFRAKNSEFFRFKYLNFPPKNLDVIVGVGHGDNRGTSSIGHFNFKPITTSPSLLHLPVHDLCVPPAPWHPVVPHSRSVPIKQAI